MSATGTSAMGGGCPTTLLRFHRRDRLYAERGGSLEPDAPPPARAPATPTPLHEFAARYPDIPVLRGQDQRGLGPGPGPVQRRASGSSWIGLQEFTGEEIKDDNLQRVAECCNRSTELYWDLWELKKQAPCPVPGIFSPFTYGARFTMWGGRRAQLLQACVGHLPPDHGGGGLPGGGGAGTHLLDLRQSLFRHTRFLRVDGGAGHLLPG